MRYSILINTCDAYNDAWPMFFFLLGTNWEGQLPDIYVNTETKSLHIENMNVHWLFQNETKSINFMWGERLLDALSRIEEQYILMMLEDFYYEDTIDGKKIDKIINYMEDHEEVAAFQLVPAGECNNNSFFPKESILGGFVKRKKKGKYTVIAGPTLWRKSDLIAITSKVDNPWEWEYFGSYRTWFYGKSFYCWPCYEKPIFNYDIIHGGAIHRGKWVGYKLKELELKYNYQLDYGTREIEDDWMKESDFIKPPLPFYKRIKSISINRIKALYNIMYGAILYGKRHLL